jgi:hypothetical protein
VQDTEEQKPCEAGFPGFLLKKIPRIGQLESFKMFA